MQLILKNGSVISEQLFSFNFILETSMKLLLYIKQKTLVTFGNRIFFVDGLKEKLHVTFEWYKNIFIGDKSCLIGLNV